MFTVSHSPKIPRYIVSNFSIQRNKPDQPLKMPSKRVLICGAGVSGSIVAFWLGQHDFEVVVVERSPANQKLGQGIEIEEPALSVVRAMGILDKLKQKKTGEMGCDLVDHHSKSHALFKIGGISPTGELELMRGDLTEVLYKAADEHDNVTYNFETTIQSLRQTTEKVVVEIVDKSANTSRTEEFDLVVGADGVKSRTRQLCMGSPEELNCFKPVGAFTAYFSIPKQDRDWPYSRMCHFPGRRVIWIRPVSEESDFTSVYFIHVHDRDRAMQNQPTTTTASLRQANASGDRLKQKRAFADLYSDLGWETPRVIEQMLKSENFYSDELVQVKLPRWSQNRVVLVGDAAWAPSPFTGEGNQLAIIGAHVLAQELSRHSSPSEAFDVYEKRLRPYVEECQKIPLNGYAPYVFVPETTWGIWILRTLLWLLSLVVQFISWTGLTSMLPDGGHNDFDLELDNTEPKKER